MSTFKAKGFATSGPKEPLAPYDFERREPRDHDVVIDIKYCGICHSDIHQVRDEWGHSKFPMVPGHEIVGIVRAVGSKTTKFAAGDRAGVGCLVDSCRECAHCLQSLEQYCLKGYTLTYNSVERDGKTPTFGGYSDAIVVDERFVVKIPESLPLDRAAPLLCAGITLYSPLVHWKAGPGKRVGVIGLGGLGHVGVKIAAALGAEVFVFSTSDRKRDDALNMGAKHFLNSTVSGAFEGHANSFDLIINTVSASMDLTPYFGLLKLDATFVNVSAPDQPLSIHPFPLISMRRNFAGSAIGGLKETQEMLDFCAEKGIACDIELIAPNQINDAFERVLKSDVKYRFVVDLSQL